MSGPYAAYVVAGYALSAVALASAAVLTWLGWLRAQRQLAAFEKEDQRP